MVKIMQIFKNVLKILTLTQNLHCIKKNFTAIIGKLRKLTAKENHTTYMSLMNLYGVNSDTQFIYII